MVGVSTTALIISTLAAVDSSEKQRSAAKDARKAEEEARRGENAAENIRAQRGKQKLLAQMRVRQAEIEQQSVTAGVSGASSVLGAVGSTGTQAASAIGFQNTMSAASLFAAGERSRGARAYSKGMDSAARSQSIGSIAGLFTDDKRNKTIASWFEDDDK
jgi:1-aminocyclopropane-1-carboxylate deaminase/D-cysteine desulfhydrase-like pyridoxal-dependent ACC family enzyme